MYSVYHEMNITNFIDTMEEFYKAAESDFKLKRIRENRGLSQTEVTEQSGINVRKIQMYEQRGNNIDKAQAHITGFYQNRSDCAGIVVCHFGFFD